MSILQEYEDIRSDIGLEKFDTIQRYLDKVSPIENYDKYDEELRKNNKLSYYEFVQKDKELKQKYGIVLLSDVLYKVEEWKKYDKWFNEEYKKRKVKINDVDVSSFDDIRFNATLYINNKQIGNIVGCCVKDIWEKELNNKEKFKELVYCEFDKYSNLPKISECSKLLQEIYDCVCESDSSMCYITEDDWLENYADKYNDEDLKKLKAEVVKYNLDNIITFGDEGYKILGYGNLEMSFIDNRNIDRSRDYER